MGKTERLDQQDLQAKLDQRGHKVYKAILVQQELMDKTERLDQQGLQAKVAQQELMDY